MSLDTNLNVLTSVPTEAQAAMIVAGLERIGIRSQPSGSLTSGFRAEAPGWVKILVTEQDLATAKTWLAETVAEDAAVDWSEVDVGQPER
jgi:hypothetical protein